LAAFITIIAESEFSAHTGGLGNRRVLFVADHSLRHLAVQAIGGFTKCRGFLASAFQELSGRVPD
jgi:hypothetical protein